MNRRGKLPSVPEPMRVQLKIIEKCRALVDSVFKAKIRIVINSLIKAGRSVSELGEGAQVGLFTKVPVGSRLGRFSYIGSNFSSDSPVCVGDLCMISRNVTLVDNDHGFDNVDLPMRLDFRWKHKITIFECDVWVGNGATIRSGLVIGRGSIIGSGAIVTKNVEPYSIVVGNPARVVRKRFSIKSISDHDIMLYGHDSFEW